jgi:hypothetical protein
MDDDDQVNEPSAAMIEHLARRLVDRYGPDAPNEAEQIVRLLTEDRNLDQVHVWTQVLALCRQLTAKPPRAVSRKP